MKGEINAVHEDQLKKTLENLGVLKKILTGQIKCKFTGEIISLENLHSFFPESGEIKFVVNTPKAISMLSDYLNRAR